MCYCTSVLVRQQIDTRHSEKDKIMTNKPYRPEPSLTGEIRRPIMPTEMSTSRLFAGWGPRV